MLLHTIGDPIIPVSQAVGYRQEVHAAGTAPSFDAFPLPRYGHCSFEPVELMTAFAILVYRTTGAALLAEAPAFERGMGPALFERTAQAQAELGWGERF